MHIKAYIDQELKKVRSALESEYWPLSDGAWGELCGRFGDDVTVDKCEAELEEEFEYFVDDVREFLDLAHQVVPSPSGSAAVKPRTGRPGRKAGKAIGPYTKSQKQRIDAVFAITGFWLGFRVSGYLEDSEPHGGEIQLPSRANAGIPWSLVANWFNKDTGKRRTPETLRRYYERAMKESEPEIVGSIASGETISQHAQIMHEVLTDYLPEETASQAISRYIAGAEARARMGGSWLQLVVGLSQVMYDVLADYLSEDTFSEVTERFLTESLVKAYSMSKTASGDSEGGSVER